MVKKTIALGGRAGTKAARLVGADGKVTVFIDCAGEAALLSASRVCLAPIEDGRAELEGRIDGPFAVGVFDGGALVLFADFGETDAKARMTAARAVNKTYDDEAIADENYFLYERAQKAAFLGETFEKGHFFQSGGEVGGQYSTIYPQSNGGENEHERKAIPHKSEPCELGAGEVPTEKFGGGFGGPSQNERGSREKQEYFEQIKTELFSVLSRFPRYFPLENIMTETMFVRVNYSEGRFYVVGLAAHGGEPEYVIFGVPEEDSPHAPKALEGISFYVPSPFLCEKGHFLIFQRASDGSVVKNPTACASSPR